MDMDFFKVERAFKRGDPRPLARWVLTRDMTNDQKEFVAKAICGDIEKIDGRKVKPLTDAIEQDYVRFKVVNCFVESLELMDGTNILCDAEISRRLANKYGFQDADSVRRAISRHKKKMHDAPITKKRVLVEEPGHEKK